MTAIKNKRGLLVLVILSLVVSSFLSLFPVSAAGNDYEGMMLIPGGMTFGVQLKTKGVLVIGRSSVKTKEGSANPAADAEIEVCDIIYEIDGKRVNTVEEVTRLVENSQGSELDMTLIRKGKKLQKELTPVLSENDGCYKAGIWIRDNSSGIGTITFIDAEKKLFAGLGHGICDIDTGVLMPMLSGRVTDVTLTGIKKGRVGIPGELRGFFGATKTGELIGNTACGVYGRLDTLPNELQKPLPVASSDKVVPGKAYIYSTTDGKTEKYEIEIVKIADRKRDNKNFVIEVKDERLLEKTDGIVQGMSGSPVIQNGKIIGAVTHVMINNPKQGYGVFIENMLEKMPEFN